MVARKVRKNMRDYPAASVEYSSSRRHNGNNNDENIVRLIFYEHTFSLAAARYMRFGSALNEKYRRYINLNSNSARCPCLHDNWSYSECRYVFVKIRTHKRVDQALRDISRISRKL